MNETRHAGTSALANNDEMICMIEQNGWFLVFLISQFSTDKNDYFSATDDS